MGPIHIDLERLDDLGRRLEGVSQQLDDGAVDIVDEQQFGDSRIASAMHEFVDRVTGDLTDTSTKLTSLASAASQAAAGYRDVEDRFRTDLSADGAQ